MRPESKTTAISRRQALTLAAGAAAFVSRARVTARQVPQGTFPQQNKLSKGEILGALSEFVSAVDMSFEDEPSIEEALFVWKDSPAQFADCLIGARYRASGCSATAIFDNGAVRLPGFIPA